MILLLLGLFSCVLGVPTYGGEDLVCQRTPYYDESASLIKVTFINSGLSQHFDLCAYNSDGGLDFVGFLESNANTNVQISKGKDTHLERQTSVLNAFIIRNALELMFRLLFVIPRLEIRISKMPLILALKVTLLLTLGHLLLPPLFLPLVPPLLPPF